MFEHKLQPELDLNEVFQFMQEFKCDFINRFCEIIIDEATNTYVSINECRSLEDVKARILMTMCRPIGKGLELSHAIQVNLKRIKTLLIVDFQFMN
ncbi:hypothetical protein MHB40_14635 [Lysinibacillus sp. FSL K6-0057]|uniref:hypothetical protein n=1 Tax=Lysinibacillus sp. FSL K6-0057 TaxID=2921411 RepID=UPI003159AA63